jgi:hypothetical protein
MNRRGFFAMLGAAAAGTRTPVQAVTTDSFALRKPNQVHVQMTLDGEDVADVLLTEISKGGRVFYRLKQVLE